MYDSAEREKVVREYVDRVRHNPTQRQVDEAVRAITAAWTRDQQDVHERSYQDGAEGVMA